METENHYEEVPQETEEKRQFNSCSEACKAGKEDAAAKAREAAPKLKAALAGALYDVAYGATYGAVFAGAFANEFVPKSVKNAVEKGVAKGAAAGRSAADKLRARKQTAASSHDERQDDGSLELPAPA